MRSWFWTLVVLAIAVGLALLVHDYSGNVLIIAQPWRIELSLTLAVVLVALCFFVLYAVLRFLSWLGRSPGRLRAWRGRRAQKRDIELLERGWVHALEGYHVQAEKDFSNLLSRTRSPDRKVLAGLSSARALHVLGEYSRRDQTLVRAREGAGGDARLRQAVDIVTAEMYLDQGLADQALGLLEPHQDSSSRFLHVTRLLLRVHRLLHHPDKVYVLTRLLLRHHAIDAAQGRQFIREAVGQQFARCDEAGWKRLWGELNGDERKDPAIALAAACAQVRLGDSHEAGRILKAALDNGMDDSLLRAYAQCDAEQARARLGQAELWLRSHPEHPGLLAALGQLCLAAQLWGKGAHYLERSLALREDAHIHALLGNLHHALGHRDEAFRHWQRACEQADATIPEIRRLLPAADTRSDPHFDDAAVSREDPVPGAPEAASGVYMEEDDASTAVAPSAPGANHRPDAVRSTSTSDEDYFDTAPIPGVDMSQTSDGGSQNGNGR